MNVLSYIHIHRLPNPSGVGRVIDQLLSSHVEQFPATCHRMLVDRTLYNNLYLQLGATWKKTSFITYASPTSLQQARWVGLNKPVAEKYWDDVDIVYCPAESYVPTTRAKLVCTIHDVAGFEENLYPNDRSRRLHCFKWRLLFNRMAASADAVVTVSDFSASRIAHFFPALKSKLRVIYNAAHPVFGSCASPAVAQEADQWTGGSPFILAPGGLSLRKNAEIIVQAIPLLAKAFPDVKLVVPGSYDADYLRRARSSPANNLILPGYVSDELLNALYQKAEVVWFPSRYEGFGMPVVEAMAGGAPVVASAAASIPEVAGSAALLCDMDAPAEHVEAIGSLLESSKMRSAMRNKSLEQAKQFSWAASASKLEDLFRSL